MQLKENMWLLEGIEPASFVKNMSTRQLRHCAEKVSKWKLEENSAATYGNVVQCAFLNSIIK